MQYSVVVTADLHWGVMEPNKQLSQYQCLLDYLRNNPVDLLVIAGDYFDHRLSFDSTAAKVAMRYFDDIVEISKEKKFKIRLIKGTQSHEYDQLDQFNIYVEDSNDTVRIFRECTAEETLPEFSCLYCPDELINSENYFLRYNTLLLDGNHYDAMFFHGTFDAEMGDFAHVIGQKNNIIFEIATFNQLCNVMIGGHWHDADTIGNMHYTRSLTSWRYDEDKPKGFIHLIYDTDKDVYSLDRIVNPTSDKYYTVYVETSLYSSREMYSELISKVDDMLRNDSGPETHVRIMIYITDSKELNGICIDTLKQHYGANHHVKIVIENKVTKAKKAEKVKKTTDLKSKYGFLMQSSSVIDNYVKFIKVTKNIDVDKAEIAELITPLLEECKNGKEKQKQARFGNEVTE